MGASFASIGLAVRSERPRFRRPLRCRPPSSWFASSRFPGLADPPELPLLLANPPRGIALREARRVEQLADLPSLAGREGRALEPFARFPPGLPLPEPEPRHELLRFGE